MKKYAIGLSVGVLSASVLFAVPALSMQLSTAVPIPTCTKPTSNVTHVQIANYMECLSKRSEAIMQNDHTPEPAPTVTETVTVTPSPTTTTSPTPTPTSGPLNLPRIPWEGRDYWKKFSKADAAGWDDPTFFPITVFLSPPHRAADLKALGINTYMGVEHNLPLSQATNEGMFVLPQQEEWLQSEVGTDPGAVGWLISDECEMGYSGCDGEEAARLAKQQEYVDKVAAYNDGRFKHANFGNGVLETFWAPNTMDEHVQMMDSASADKYAYTSPGVNFEFDRSPSWPEGADSVTSAAYGWQVDQMRKFQDPADINPIWGVVETKRPFLNESGARTITPNQIEGAVWSMIAHEARGITYFQHNNDPSCGVYSLLDCGATLQSRITDLNAQIKALAPVLNTQSYEYTFNNNTDTMLKTHAGDAYIFASIGTLESPGTKTFTLPNGVTGTTVTVVGENRTIPVVDGQFSDDFAAEYSHHIYRITL